MIPLERYSKRAADQLLQYLIAEFRRAESDRKPLEEKWLLWEWMYRARPEFREKKFPWPGCSNLVIPIIATDIEIVHARLMAELFGPQNLWSCRGLHEGMVEFAARLQEFLQWAQNHELDIYPVINDWLMEICKLGTGILKTRYTRELRKVYEYREAQTLDGSQQVEARQTRVLLKDHPAVHHVSLFDFFVPASSLGLQEAVWCCERVWLTWAQYVSRVNAGLYMSLPQIGQWWANERGSTAQLAVQGFANFVPSYGDKIGLHEFWLDWDIDDDGEQEALVCTIHVPSMSYVRLDFNPFFNQEKPYDVARYIRQPKSFYGMGLGEMLEQFQHEITTQHNQRIDNNTVQNAGVVTYLKNGNIKSDMPIYPGVQIAVDQIGEVAVTPFGTPYHKSTIPDEQQSLMMAKARSGVNDFISGGDDNSISYATATTAVQQLREGNKRFDQLKREVRVALSSVGMKVTELYQQFNQRGKPFLAQGPADGAAVFQILQFPLDIIRMGVGIDVTATSASYNKEVEIRTNTIIMQMLNQFYQMSLQFIQLAINPQVPEPIRQIAQQAAHGQSVLMRRMLDSYNVQDAADLIPNIQGALANGQQQLSSLQAAYNGGTPVGQGNGGISGIPLLPASNNGAQSASAAVAGPGFFGR